MGLIDKYPYTNYAGLNLDYYIQKVNSVESTQTIQQATIDGSVKDIDTSNHTITVKKNDGSSYNVSVPGSGSVYCLNLKLKEDNKRPGDGDLSVGGNSFYTFMSEADTEEAFKANVDAGNPTMLRLFDNDEKLMAVGMFDYYSRTGTDKIYTIALPTVYQDDGVNVYEIRAFQLVILHSPSLSINLKRLV